MSLILNQSINQSIYLFVQTSLSVKYFVAGKQNQDAAAAAESVRCNSRSYDIIITVDVGMRSTRQRRRKQHRTDVWTTDVGQFSTTDGRGAVTDCRIAAAARSRSADEGSVAERRRRQSNGG